jgi:CubicO group peptidase (beta-lactamase class C family)
MGDRASAFGNPGYGGAIGFADPAHRFAFALTKNRMVASPPGESTANRVATATRRALGIPEAG